MAIDINQILAELDTEIARLRQIRAALTGGQAGPTGTATAKKRGRPKGSKNSTAEATVPKKRTMSPEARKRIADAQKKRWADQKQETPSPPETPPPPSVDEANPPA